MTSSCAEEKIISVSIVEKNMAATNSKEDAKLKTITVRDTPTKLIIKSLTLTLYPQTKPNGSSWDAYSAPDIFFVINGGNNMGDDGGLGVVPQAPPGGDAHGQGDDVLDRAAQLDAEHVGVRVRSEGAGGAQRGHA